MPKKKIARNPHLNRNSIEKRVENPRRPMGCWSVFAIALIAAFAIKGCEASNVHPEEKPVAALESPAIQPSIDTGVDVVAIEKAREQQAAAVRFEVIRTIIDSVYSSGRPTSFEAAALNEVKVLKPTVDDVASGFDIHSATLAPRLGFCAGSNSETGEDVIFVPDDCLNGDNDIVSATVVMGQSAELAGVHMGLSQSSASDLAVEVERAFEKRLEKVFPEYK